MGDRDMQGAGSFPIPVNQNPAEEGFEQSIPLELVKVNSTKRRLDDGLTVILIFFRRHRPFLVRTSTSASFWR
jgi:hypothetical protein